MAQKKITSLTVEFLPPGFSAMKAMIYFTEFSYIVRGIFLESTPYKATKYVRNFTYPIFRYDRIVFLSYSPRITRVGERGAGGYFTGSDEEVAAMILESVHHDGLIQDLMTRCTPPQFLARHFPTRTESGSAATSFDLACAAALCNEESIARQAFAACRKYLAFYLPDPWAVAVETDVDAALRALDRGVAGFQAHMQSSARAAAAALGIAPPRF